MAQQHGPLTPEQVTSWRTQGYVMADNIFLGQVPFCVIDAEKIRKLADVLDPQFV